jgi:undecaprenyl-diphosphatase
MDISLFHVINGLAGHNIWLDRAIRWYTTWGALLMGAVLAGAWFLPGTIEDRGRRERLVTYAVIAALIGLGISQIIGHLWFRERPYVSHQAHLLIAMSGDPSFPSDHAVGAFALAAPFLFARHRLAPWLLGMATLLAISRVTAGTHYPDDVFAGACLGMTAGWLVWNLRGLVEPLLTWGLNLAHRLRVA